MERRQSDGLRIIFDSLTLEERRQLRAIAFRGGMGVTEPVSKRLAELGLVQQEGALLVATKWGEKLARRC